MNSFWNGFEKQALSKEERAEHTDYINDHNRENSSRNSAVPTAMGAGVRKGMAWGATLGGGAALVGALAGKSFAGTPILDSLSEASKPILKAVLGYGALGAGAGIIGGNAANRVASKPQDFKNLSDEEMASSVKSIKDSKLEVPSGIFSKFLKGFKSHG